MPYYFFHLHLEGHRIPDEEGMELNDLEAAREEALISAREIACEVIKTGKLIDGDHIEVANGEGNILFTVPVMVAAN